MGGRAFNACGYCVVSVLDSLHGVCGRLARLPDFDPAHVGRAPHRHAWDDACDFNDECHSNTWDFDQGPGTHFEIIRL